MQRSYVVAIDIGVINMGVVELERVGAGAPCLLSCRRLDITANGNCCRTACPLGHTGAMADWIQHLLTYDNEFTDACARASVVLIERQPPLGFRDCEQLLFSALREKAVLVQPRSVHSQFMIGSLTYDERKDAACRIVNSRFSECQAWATFKGRSHDVADAVLIALWGFEKHPELVKVHKPPPSIDELVSFDAIEQYRCKRPKQAL